MKKLLAALAAAGWIAAGLSAQAADMKPVPSDNPKALINVFPGMAGGMFPRPPRPAHMKRPPRLPKEGMKPPVQRPLVRPETMADILHNDYGTDKKELISYLNSGIPYRTLKRLGLYAYITKKPLGEIISLSQLYGKDDSLRKVLGLTDQILRDGTISFQADRLEKRMAISRADTIQYLNMGFPMHHINTAALLERKTHRSMYDIMKMKTRENSWNDVALQLGLTIEDMQEIKDMIKKGFPYI